MNKPTGFRIITTGICLWFALLGISHASSWPEAIENGTVSLQNRLRYEFVEQGGFNSDASALTIRTRLGYQTAALEGMQAFFQVEHITALIDDYANSIGSNPTRPVVIDPEVTEVNQFWLSYKGGDTLIKAGRQQLILDNARFVGDVGWRQDQQTFDALLIQDKSIDKLTVSYAYLWEILRIQADARNWDSDSHLIHINYGGFSAGSLSAYGYFLDLGAASASNRTLGASFVGAQKVGEWKLAYRLEYANQEDFGNNPVSYKADYYAAEVGPAFSNMSFALGLEYLEDGFRTPLGTVHAFNGWSDFRLPVLGNPLGLVDYYAKVTAKLPEDISLLAFYHRFESDVGGITYGDEWDLQLVKKLNKTMTVLAKAAWFDGKNGLADLKKVWLQFEYNF